MADKYLVRKKPHWSLGPMRFLNILEKITQKRKIERCLSLKDLKNMTVYSKKPAPRAGFYKKREKYEKNLSNNCFLLFDGFILQQVCEQAVSEE